jgi:hypothetical protein
MEMEAGGDQVLVLSYNSKTHQVYELGTERALEFARQRRDIISSFISCIGGTREELILVIQNVYGSLQVVWLFWLLST